MPSTIAPFQNPVTPWIVVGVAAALALGALLIFILGLAGRLTATLRHELWLRLGSWCALAPLMIVPILLGRSFTIAAVALLGLACYREYARATGLFREHVVSFIVVLGILAVNLAAIDHWYGFFMALAPLGCGFVAIVSIPFDRPQGYVQRVGLGIFGFFLFGAGLAHFGYMANDPNYRPLLLMLLLAVGLNAVGRRRQLHPYICADWRELYRDANEERRGAGLTRH